LDGVTAIGSATVDGDGNWSVTAATLSSGLHALTATETDATGNLSAGSAQLALVIDGTVVTSTTFKLGDWAGALSMGIAPPSSSLFSAEQLTITVSSLPDNGVVTLSDGTPVTVGQVLGSGELTGLLFTPASGQPETTSAFVYTVTDPQNDIDTGTITLMTGFSGQPEISTNGPVSNADQPQIQGTASPGTQVTLLNNGVAIGTATTDGDGNFAIQPETPLPLGLARLTVTSVLPNGTTTASAPLVQFVVQSPVAGVSTTSFSSADIGAALNQGARLAFIPGTGAVQLVDATLSFGADTGEATIQRLYEGLLGRSSDTTGISGWDDMLLSGASKSAIAAGLLTSDEYAGGHPGTQTDLQFVDGLYNGLLGRTADAPGEASWLHQLAAGASRGDVATGVADSDEAKTHLAASTAQLFVPHVLGTAVHEMFETGLGREIELPALSHFNSAFDGSSLSQLAAAIAAAPEFLAHHGNQDNTAFVNDLYLRGLGRAAEQGGLTAWTQALDTGSLSRGDVLLGIATSREAAAHLTFNLAG
jgi:hypothetical protein